jgi:hypothetical protein
MSLHATEESALNTVSLNDLTKYKADAEAPNQTNKQDSHIEPGISENNNKSSNHPAGVPRVDMGQHN